MEADKQRRLNQVALDLLELRAMIGAELGRKGLRNLTRSGLERAYKVAFDAYHNAIAAGAEQ